MSAPAAIRALRRLSSGAGIGLSLSILAADPAPAVSFLARETAAETIADDRTYPYFSHLGLLEIEARMGGPSAAPDLAAARDACRRRYREEAQAFTEEERQAVAECLKRLSPLLERYPAVARLPWSFLKVSERVDAGLPHTRGPHIVLPEPVLGMFVRWRRKALPGDLGPGLILAHEQLHVLQRAEPGRFKPLYEEWGFRHVAPFPLPADLERRVVRNPDGLDLGWVFLVEEGERSRWIWPTVAWKAVEGIPRMPKDFEMLAADVEETPEGFRVKAGAEGRASCRPLLEEKAFVERFEGTRNIYHPNEAAAGLFEAVLKADQAQGPLTPLQRRFRDLLR